MTISWAIHRLNGISSPASAAYSASELAFQLQNSGTKCLFTCEALLPTALEAANIAGIPKSQIYLCPVPENTVSKSVDCIELKNLDGLISSGKALPDLESQQWSEGQGKRQTAFICYSSGTSGLPVKVHESCYRVKELIF